MESSDNEEHVHDHKKRKHLRPVSPPVIKRKKSRLVAIDSQQQQSIAELNTGAEGATPSSIESGQHQIQDHLAFYTRHIAKHIRPSTTLLSLSLWRDLYTRNRNHRGQHFVIHQHDHPIAGTHYDLRLQINKTSSISWAIMYGVPGDPNSKRLNRNAVETRVHCVWNHLVEAASLTTGSLLIWDTGEYQVLPIQEDTTDGESESDGSKTEPEKLADAFDKGKIKLRLTGSRLPKGYVLYIRMSRDARVTDRKMIAKKRRKHRKSVTQLEADDVEEIHDDHSGVNESEEDTRIQKQNAYPGADNTIGSIYQRKWYASMDRILSGFRRIKKNGETAWVRGNDGSGFEPFRVLGRDHERSIVSGRLATEVMADEMVIGYVSRRGWRPILE